MSRITFSAKEIKTLQKNPNVQRVSERSITYTDEFKNRFIDEYQTGKLPRQIIEENGFNADIIGIKRIEQSAHRWKKAYEKNGLIGLTDSRKISSGRPLKRELTATEIIERQKARIELLEGKVDLLKKLEATERRLLNSNENLTVKWSAMNEEPYIYSGTISDPSIREVYAGDERAKIIDVEDGKRFWYAISSEKEVEVKMAMADGSQEVTEEIDEEMLKAWQDKND